MDILEKWLRTHPADSTSDIPLYEVVAEELESGYLNKGAWAKAFAEANGDKEKARALYLKLRVGQLPQEIASFQAELSRSKRTFEEKLLALSRRNIPDMDHVSSSRFDGEVSSISEPVPISEVSRLASLPEFQIIDLIKSGRLRGVRCGEVWFVDGNYVDTSG